MEDDFHSLSKGVFVIPFQPHDHQQAEAGPSKRPLDRLYTTAWERYEQAHADYESARTAEQLDDVADWIERCATPPLLKRAVKIHRIPIAIVQNASTSLGSLLPTLTPVSYTLHARDAPDLTSCTRAIVTGFMGESVGKKSGRSGAEELEIWWRGRKDKSALVLHIEQAQQVPSNVLAELVYILSLHPDLPIRLLLSVPSTATFLSSWTPIEPSSIDICILQSGRTRRRAAGVNAILKESHQPLFGLSDELADELRREDDLLGGGGTATLKSLKWLLLHHSMNSPLNDIDTSNEDQLRRVQALANAIASHPDEASVPGKDLLQLQPQADMASTSNPAPRISVLHALANSQDFLTVEPVTQNTEGANDVAAALDTSTRTPRRSRTASSSKKRVSDVAIDDGPDKRVRTNGHATIAGVNGNKNGESEEELKELKTLFELWRGAGRSVNLWDWLEAFRGTMADQKATSSGDAVEGEGRTSEADTGDDGENAMVVDQTDRDQEEKEITTKDKDKDKDNGNSNSNHQNEMDVGDGKHMDDQQSDEEDARLHAIFIRFCEEARMMGLVRARGKGRRADDVVKGMGLV